MESIVSPSLTTHSLSFDGERETTAYFVEAYTMQRRRKGIPRAMHVA